MAKRAQPSFVALLAFLGLVGTVACGETTPPPVAPPPPPPAPAPPPPPAPPPAPAPKLSMPEMQKNAIIALVAAYNAHDAKKLGELYTADAVDGGPGDNGWEEDKGREGLEKDAKELFTAFPDLKIATLRVIQQGDTAVWEWVATGTHKGEFVGSKPTNKPIGFSGANVLWFSDDGHIKRDHGYDDEGTILSQVGASKERGRPVATLPSGDGEWVMGKGTPEENKNIEAMKGAFGVLEKRDEKAFMAWVADDVLMSDQMAPSDVKGKDAAKKEFKTWTTAFPDMKLSPTTVVAGGDWVAAEIAYEGTMKGPFAGFRPTKRRGKFHVLEVAKIKDGKVASLYRYGDSEEMESQFGLVVEHAK